MMISTDENVIQSTGTSTSDNADASSDNNKYKIIMLTASEQQQATSSSSTRTVAATPEALAQARASSKSATTRTTASSNSTSGPSRRSRFRCFSACLTSILVVLLTIVITASIRIMTYDGEYSSYHSPSELVSATAGSGPLQRQQYVTQYHHRLNQEYRISRFSRISLRLLRQLLLRLDDDIESITSSSRNNHHRQHHSTISVNGGGGRSSSSSSSSSSSRSQFRMKMIQMYQLLEALFDSQPPCHLYPHCHCYPHHDVVVHGGSSSSSTSHRGTSAGPSGHCIVQEGGGQGKEALQVVQQHEQEVEYEISNPKDISSSTSTPTNTTTTTTTADDDDDHMVFVLPYWNVSITHQCRSRVSRKNSSSCSSSCSSSSTDDHHNNGTDDSIVFSDTYEEARQAFRRIAKQIHSSVVVLSYPIFVSSSTMNSTTCTTTPTTIKEKDSEQNDGTTTTGTTTSSSTCTNPNYSNNDMNSCHSSTSSTNEYTIDIAIIPGKRSGIVVHTSGVHGVEGYAGSAIQIAFLKGLYQYQQQKKNNKKQQQQQARNNNNDDFTMNNNDTTNNAEHGDDMEPLLTDCFQDLPTIVLIHSVNPYGMAHYRRTNEHNVDLNRNALTQDQWEALSPSYQPSTSTILSSQSHGQHDRQQQRHYNQINYERFEHTFFNPGPQVIQGSFYMNYQYWYIAIYHVFRYGLSTLKAAMIGGQYHNPKGIFYGGQYHIEPSIQIIHKWWEKFMARHLHQQQQPNHDSAKHQRPPVVTWIDVHTGLGPPGVDTLLTADAYHGLVDFPRYFPDSHHAFFCPQEELMKLQKNNDIFTNTQPMVQLEKEDDDPSRLYRQRQRQRVAQQVGQGYEHIQGTLDAYLSKLTPSKYHGLFLAQEFGTIPTFLVGRAMIVENAAYHHASSTSEAIQWAQRTTRPAYYPYSTVWRQQIIQRGIQVLFQAMNRSISLSETTP